MTILIFIAVLGLLVFVHELGHFVTARRNGVDCHEFGFGFPPRAIGVVKDKGKWKVVGRKDETDYKNTVFSLNWIPLGGFVRIKGEDGEDQSVDSFATKSIWVRFKILVAGVVMNVVLAWALFAVALTIGMDEPRDEPRGTGVVVAQIMEGAAAEQMGLRKGDAVKQLCLGEGTEVCSAVRTTAQLQEEIAQNKGNKITLTGARGLGEFSVVGILPAEATDKGILGVQLEVPTEFVSYDFGEALVVAAQKTYNALGMIFAGLGMLIGSLFGGASVGGDVAGPVGIAVMTGQAASSGVAYLAFFAAILSANLAVINILPIPALDGGRIVFLIIEKLRGGRPVSKKIEGYTHGISFILLILLMVVVTVFDVMKYL